MSWRNHLAWEVKVAKSVVKELKKLGGSNAIKIVKFFRELELLSDPKLRGKSLKGNLKQYWRYRVGDYRIFCEFKDDELVIIAVKIGHRRDIYN